MWKHLWWFLSAKIMMDSVFWILQSSTPEWYTTPIWYTFVYSIASPNHHRFFSNKISWLHIHTNKSSTKFQVNWTSCGSTVKCSKVDILRTLPKMPSPPNDTPVFCKFLQDNTKESSEIWRDGSHWLTESYYVVFMGKTYCSELKIEFNDFTVSLRGGWLYYSILRSSNEAQHLTWWAQQICLLPKGAKNNFFTHP